MKLNRKKTIGLVAAVATLGCSMLLPISTASAVQNEGGEPSASNQASQSIQARSEDLQTILDSTRTQDLKPLASGYQAGDKGTAPYDHVAPNAGDLTALSQARTRAEQLLASGTASQNDKDQAGKDLKQAFAAVRFVYHYTGVTGTNGARIFDNNGSLIQAHGAGVQRVRTALLPAGERGLDANGDGYVYILCGEDKTDGLIARGVRIYYSDDLCNWVDKGLGFQTYRGDADLAAKQAGADSIYQRYYTVANLRSDPDYTNIYGSNYDAFASDSSNANISNPQQALNYLLWDLKALKGNGSDPTKSSCVFERPKMVYNPTTNRWVIWFHADGPQYGNENTATYSKAKAGVAISEGSDPAGPYKYLGSFRMSPGANAGNPGMARDMNLYVDSGKDLDHDGADDAYLVYASNENRDLTISLLDRTYTKLVEPNARQRQGTDVGAGDTYNILASNSKESPAPFMWNGKYYIIYSGTTGWAPNENKYAASQGDNILGPYSEVGTPFVKGDGPNQSPGNSFMTQSSSVIPYDPEHGVFLYWGDRWFNPDTGNDISQSRYVMTPMQLVNGQVKVLPAADWSLSGMDRYQAIDVDTSLPTEADSVSRLMAGLPDKLAVKVGGRASPQQTDVDWDPYFGADQPYGSVTLTGRLPGFQKAPISFTAAIYPKDSRLFMDAGSDPAHESAYYQRLKTKAPGLINSNRSDQVYSSAGTWGLASRTGADVERYGTSQSDIYETGYWAKGGKDIRYRADLPAGSYTVQAGYKEWWSNKRQTVFSVVCDGKTLGKTNIVPSQGGNATDPVAFTLDHAASVTFLTQSIGGGDPLLSWVGVSALGGDQVASVEPVKGTMAFKQGQQPGLPDKVTVKKVDGSSQERSVRWIVDASSLTPYSPTEIRGAVDGSTLPAKATLQMVEDGLAYFVDVNGGASSPTYKSAAKLTDGGLVNPRADQACDGLWGNASDNYGRQSDADADPYQSGIYAGTDGHKGNLTYKLLLAPGKHQFSFGFHDWWNQSRPTTISYQYDGMPGTRSGEAQLTAAVDGGRTIASGELEIPQGWNKLVTFTLESPTGTGPILNWISVRGARPLGPSSLQQEPAISGTAALTIDQGASFDPMAGVSAVDNLEGDLSAAISVQGSVDSAKAGRYELTYTVANARGKQVSMQRFITVSPRAPQPGGSGNGSSGGSGGSDPGSAGAGAGAGAGGTVGAAGQGTAGAQGSHLTGRDPAAAGEGELSATGTAVAPVVAVAVAGFLLALAFLGLAGRARRR